MNQCPNNFARFCRPVLLYNHDVQCDLTLRGSSLLFRHKSRYFVICTSHQFGVGSEARAPEDMVIAIMNENNDVIGLTGSEVTRIRIKDLAHENAEDMLLMEYDTVKSGRDLTPLFFNIDLENIGTLNTVPPENIDAIFTIGFISNSTDYDPVFDEDYNQLGTTIVSRWSKLYLQPTEVGPWLPNLRAGLEVHECQREATVNSADYDPDGLSGAPVGFIYRDQSEQRHFGFAGMITHADKLGRFAIYPTELINQIMAKHT